MKKRKREEEQEENETETVKRKCEGFTLWRPLKSLVKGETWRVVVICLGRIPLEKHEDLSDC